MCGCSVCRSASLTTSASSHDNCEGRGRAVEMLVDTGSGSEPDTVQPVPGEMCACSPAGVVNQASGIWGTAAVCVWNDDCYSDVRQ